MASLRRHVFRRLLTQSSDIRVSVRSLLPSPSSPYPPRTLRRSCLFVCSCITRLTVAFLGTVFYDVFRAESFKKVEDKSKRDCRRTALHPSPFSFLPSPSIQPGAAGFDWSSKTLLLKGTPVIFVSVHLTCNTGIAGTNLQKLSQRSARTSPTLVSPLSLQVIGMFCLPSCLNRAARIKGEILLPCDLELSCTSGRLIDCAICHRSLVNIAELQSFVEGPWKTLQALLLTLPRSPKRFFTRSLTTSHMKFPPQIATLFSPLGPSVSI